MNDAIVFLALAWVAACVYVAAKFMRAAVRMTQLPSCCFGGAEVGEKRELGTAALMMVGLSAMPVIWVVLS